MRKQQSVFSSAQAMLIADGALQVIEEIRQVKEWALSGAFNFYGVIAAVRRIVPLTLQPGRDLYGFRNDLREQGVWSVRRLNKHALAVIPSYVIRGYRTVKNLEDAVEEARNQGEEI